MPKTCASCKTVSESGEGYVEGSLEPGEYCPACQVRRGVNGGKLMLFLWFPAMLSLGLLGAHFEPKDPVGWITLNGLLFYAFQMASILPHELGHALAGRLAGMRVHGIHIGYGPRLFSANLFGLKLQVNLIPLMGFTLLSDPRAEGYKGRMMMAVAGGPLVNLLLLAAVFPFLTMPFPWKSALHSVQPAFAFALANALVLLLNLIPRKIRFAAGVQHTDGFLLAALPFFSPEQIREQVAVHYLLEGSGCLEQKRFDEAVRWFRDGLDKHPDSVSLRNNLAVALLRSGKDEDALAEFRAVAASEKLDPTFRQVVHCNIAVTIIIMGRQDLFEEAERLSGEAMKSVAWFPYVQGVHGSVLIERGRMDEGLALVRTAYGRQTDPDLRAYDACVLALAVKTKGYTDEGRKYLAEAERLNPACRLLPRVRRELAQ